MRGPCTHLHSGGWKWPFWGTKMRKPQCQLVPKLSQAVCSTTTICPSKLCLGGFSRNAPRTVQMRFLAILAQSCPKWCQISKGGPRLKWGNCVWQKPPKVGDRSLLECPWNCDLGNMTQILVNFWPYGALNGSRVGKMAQNSPRVGHMKASNWASQDPSYSICIFGVRERHWWASTTRILGTIFVHRGPFWDPLLPPRSGRHEYPTWRCWELPSGENHSVVSAP